MLAGEMVALVNDGSVRIGVHPRGSRSRPRDEWRVPLTSLVTAGPDNVHGLSGLALSGTRREMTRNGNTPSAFRTPLAERFLVGECPDVGAHAVLGDVAGLITIGYERRHCASTFE